MKRVRLTYEGAYHHCMNRGINGEDIFSSQKLKAQFVDYLEEAIEKYKIRLFAYCVMNNHYHLILENSSGKLSDFFLYLNGQYGMFYRQSTRGRGYVFQSRFKSTLIQDDSYLQLALCYVLLNPVRAGIVQTFDQYLWSSGRFYFSDQECGFLDVDFVNELFGSRSGLMDFLISMGAKDLPLLETKYGEILGNSDYVEEAVSRFNRRKRYYGDGMKRIDDRFFEPVEKIIWEFEQKIGCKIEEINLGTLQGKRIRGELLVRLKDLGGLRYSEISKISIFWSYRYSSMAKLYRDTKHRLSKISSTK